MAAIVIDLWPDNEIGHATFILKCAVHHTLRWSGFPTDENHACDGGPATVARLHGVLANDNSTFFKVLTRERKWVGPEAEANVTEVLDDLTA